MDRNQKSNITNQAQTNFDINLKNTLKISSIKTN